MPASQDTFFPRLVSLAAHDLRTPLATVHGFARTIQKTSDLGEPLERYVEMIAAAAAQMADLLETVALVARIEGGRYDPTRVETDTLELARSAAERVEGAQADGIGEGLETDRDAVTRSLAAFALCALRHGSVGEVVLHVEGRNVTFTPIGPAGAILLGEDLRDLGAAVATRAVRELGGTVAVEGDALRVRL